MSSEKSIGTLRLYALGAVIAVVACLAYSLGRRSTEDERKSDTQLSTLDVSVLRHRLDKLSELATVSYSYTDVANHKKTEKLWGHDIPFSTSTIFLRYAGTIKAGVDLHQARISVQDTLVTFVLPRPTILSHSVDPSSIKILNQSNGLFSSIKISDFQAFCSAHKDSMESVAISSGLLMSAQENAADGLELITAPLRDMGYSVVVKFSDTLPSGVEPLPNLDGNMH